ncbi:TetR/AcrR family transcriptional regulator [Falsarthrobacter nasiphocae]|uniref:AcrR family transcriptional regulator n=1 Tax=Falsarthrobacter nasiphocae TaxID=189863 RepID=A0AAE3YGR7_9MICC|nr:TetR/AcrR family transcriptional regulator [Falsarthrobacter nasiphocae]MDR6891904.1 AcrR family transcriptional regulator [Falsarthrobacter nasiphocae]
MNVTPRGLAKADRRAQILDSAARLFAHRGYAQVTVAAIGERSGVTGPAVYRHFRSKEAILAEVLHSASKGLLEDAGGTCSDAPTPGAALNGLIELHVKFALSNSAAIRIQDRDLTFLSSPDRRRIRSTQKDYVSHWTRVLAHLRPDEPEESHVTRAVGTIGLINSAVCARALPLEDPAAFAATLQEMASLALGAPHQAAETERSETGGAQPPQTAVPATSSPGMGRKDTI